jgi:hypothetical protein
VVVTDGVGVFVGVCELVGVLVGVFVGVSVLVGVLVGVSVLVGVLVRVLVGVTDGVGVEFGIGGNTPSLFKTIPISFAEEYEELTNQIFFLWFGTSST